MSELITLKNSTLELVLNPVVGLNIMAFFAEVNGKQLPIMPDAREESCSLNESSFVMVPYSNRIEDGKFSFEGKEYQIDPTWLHSIHGDCYHRPWQVIYQDETQVVAKIDSADHPGFNWPWPLEARQIYWLVDNRLSMTLALWNRGSTNMPAGFGWHPYFSRHLTQEGEPVELQFSVLAMYPDALDNRMPSGPVIPVTPDVDFGAGKELQTEFFDKCFYGYNGEGKIVWPDSDVCLRFNASRENEHLIIYNPADPHFAVEPVTNANNGVNLLAKGYNTTGIVTLAPGECLTATFDLIVEKPVLF